MFCFASVEWYYERNFVVNAFCKHILFEKKFNWMVCLWCKFRFYLYQFSKNEAWKYLQMGSLGWVSSERNQMWFLSGSWGLSHTKDGLNSEGLGRPGARAAVRPPAASDINVTQV